MPSPTSSLATLRPDLAGSFQELDLMANAADFIAPQVLPIIESAKAAGKFGLIPIEQLMKARDVKRNPRSGYSRGDWKFSEQTFQTQEYGAEEPVDDAEAALYRDYFDAELVSTERAIHAILTNYEQLTAALFQNTGTHTATNVTNEWDDYAAATPINDVEASVQRIYAATGVWPNGIVFNRKVFRNLRNCDQIIDRINAAGAGEQAVAGKVTAAQLAAVFDLDHVFVAGGTKDTAAEGIASSLAPIWSNEYASVFRVPGGRDIKEPGFGRTIHWAEDGSMPNGIVETYRDETVRGDVVRARHQIQLKTLYTELLDLIGNVTT